VKPKRFAVEAQSNNSSNWEPVYYTNSLPVAKRHAVATVKSPKIQAARAVNQIAGQVMANEQS
jgi:hypothetical protein